MDCTLFLLNPGCGRHGRILFGFETLAYLSCAYTAGLWISSLWVSLFSVFESPCCVFKPPLTARWVTFTEVLWKGEHTVIFKEPLWTTRGHLYGFPENDNIMSISENLTKQKPRKMDTKWKKVEFLTCSSRAYYIRAGQKCWWLFTSSPQHNCPQTQRRIQLGEKMWTKFLFIDILTLTETEVVWARVKRD